MPIRVECPECGKALNIRDELRGKKIACPECREVIKVSAGKRPRPVEDDDEEAVQERPRFRVPPAKALSSRRDRDDDDYDDSPPPRRRPEKSGGKLGLILGLSGGGVALVAGIVVLILVLNQSADTKENPNPIAKGPNPKGGINPKPDPKPDPDAAKPLPPQMDLDVVQRVKQATVYLRVTSPSGQVAEGSGFFAVEPGIVFTNAHVLGMLQTSSRPPKQVDVVVHSGEGNEFKLVGQVLGVDRASDLAVVKVQGNLPAALPLEMDRKLVETQKVYIFGFPFGAQLGKNITVSESSVSSLRKDQVTGAVEQIQVNGGMHPGNSGGPVVNSLGRVIGVSVAGIRGTQINFAVPAEFVKLNLEGRFLESRHAEPYMKSGQAHAPVYFTCLDALGRIREARVEVWTGQLGQPRPFSLTKPAAMPGDGERQSHALTYQNGIAQGDVPLPKSPGGQVVWIQPVIVSAAGTTQWGQARTVDASLALERKPADLTAKLTALKERAVHLKSSQTTTLIKGKSKAVDADHAELDLVEAIAPHPQGARVRLGFARPNLSFEEDGRQGIIQPNVATLLGRIAPAFTVDNTNKLRERTDINLNPKLPFQLRAQVGEYYNQICNGYEAVNLIMPNRSLQAQETWPTMLPMLLKTGKKSEVVDLVLNCTYEGSRTRGDRQEAVISVRGRVQGRNNFQKLVDGNVAGKFAFDLAGGFIASARLAITSEVSLFGDLQVIGVFDVNLSRAPGNPLNIALPVQTGPGPGPIGPPPKGVVIAQHNSALGPTDPLDTEFGPRGSRMKIFPVKFEAGMKYSISLNSTAFDAYLRLLGPTGQVVAKDDDSGGNLNARIDYLAPTGGEYRIVATSFNGKQGPFQLTVLKLGKGVAKELPPVINPEKFVKPAASAKPASYLKFTSSPGDFIGQGKSYEYAGNLMKITRSGRGVHVNVADWTLAIGGPNLQFLEKKEYQGAKRFAFSDDSPGLELSGQGRGASNIFGAFVVWEIEVQGNDIVRLAIDFTQRCEQATSPPLHGKLRWNSTLE